MSPVWRNWAGNVTCHPARISAPASIDELADLTRLEHQRGGRVKVAGHGHSFSDIAGSDGAHLASLERLPGDITVDPTARTITVPAGIKLQDFVAAAALRGLAPANLGAVVEQTLAGAIATGTHGSGLGFGGLANLATGFEFVTGRGEVRTISRTSNPSLWSALAVSLGSLGIITRITVKCEDAFNLRLQEIPATLDATLDRLDEYNQARHFGFWWFPGTDQVLLRKFNVTNADRDHRSQLSSWINRVLLRNGLHEACLFASSVLGLVPTPVINEFVRRSALGRPRTRVGPAADIFTSKVRIRQHVMEFSVPIDDAVAAVRALRETLQSANFPAHSPIDVRFSGPDEPWLGLSHGRQSCFIGCVVYQPFGFAVDSTGYFRAFEQTMRRFDARPHWGKIHFRTAADLAGLYPLWTDFLAVRDDLDPGRVFANGYLDRVLGP
jgi:L-gulonolactone oxidase